MISSEGCKTDLQKLGAEIISFENVHFGQSYPYGNKIERLRQLSENEPLIFFDSDTLIYRNIRKGPFDLSKPNASLKKTSA
jgi:hypothetical protein